MTQTSEKSSYSSHYSFHVFLSIETITNVFRTFSVQSPWDGIANTAWISPSCYISIQLLQHCVELTITRDFTKTITLRVVTARDSGIAVIAVGSRRCGRLVFVLQRPLHGPDAQRSHVRERAEVAISNNGLRSLETHSQPLKTRVVNTTGCFKALFH